MSGNGGRARTTSGRGRLTAATTGAGASPFGPLGPTTDGAAGAAGARTPGVRPDPTLRARPTAAPTTGAPRRLPTAGRQRGRSTTARQAGAASGGPTP